MARLSDTILDARGYSMGRNAPMVSLSNGGQFGFQTDVPSFISNTAYVRRNLIAKLIEAPRGFEDLPEPNLWFAALKTLVEVEPRSIEGLQMGLSVDVAANAFGGAGEEQEDPTNVTRQRSNPSFTYLERYGRPINHFINQWITELIMDPISKYPT